MSKSITKLAPDKQFALRNKAKIELERLENTISNEETQKLIEDFKLKFSFCEIVYKVILEDHQFNKYGEHKSRLTISMREAPYALKYAGYNFDKKLLSNLFGAENRMGRRSVKKLRDSLTHSLDKKAVEELKNRKEEIFDYMDTFLNEIRDFDNGKVA